jgi:hypothetical protein
MSDYVIPDPPDATLGDRLQSALYPWLGRPEWWSADFPGDGVDHIGPCGGDRLNHQIGDNQ